MTHHIKRIGVLALQGAVSEHVNVIERVGAKAIVLKTVSQLDDLDGLIIPGGESTAIRQLMQKYHLIEPIKAFALAGKGILGTCAGLVLSARAIIGGDESLGLINCQVQRNGFGRQQQSFETDLIIPVLGHRPFTAVFIRAPFITDVGDEVEILVRYEDKIVAARQNNILVTAFHPELSNDDRFIHYFVETCL